MKCFLWTLLFQATSVPSVEYVTQALDDVITMQHNRHKMKEKPSPIKRNEKQTSTKCKNAMLLNCHFRLFYVIICVQWSAVSGEMNFSTHFVRTILSIQWVINILFSLLYCLVSAGSFFIDRNSVAVKRWFFLHGFNWSFCSESLADRFIEMANVYYHFTIVEWPPSVGN